MHKSGVSPEYDPSEFRDYLLLLARVWLPQHLQRRMDASDLVQVAQSKAIEKADQFRGGNDAQYRAWLRQILKNTLRDALKKNRRAPEESVRRLEESSSRLETKLAGEEPTASRQFALHEDLDRMAAFLSNLPEDQQQALIMKYCLGLTVAEIAKGFDRTPASVAGLLRRGLKHLRGRLAEK